VTLETQERIAAAWRA